MSLFGGDSTATQESLSSASQTTSDDDAHPTSAQQRTVIREDQIPDDGNPNNLNEAVLDSDSPSASPSDSDGESEDTESSSSSDLPRRPNRYTGKRQDWQRWTEPERSLIDGHDQLRANDLSIHLYNAHALTARLRTGDCLAQCMPWSSKSRWINMNERERVCGQLLNWYPSDAWTAWPLPPERVPRPEEEWGLPEDDGNAAYTIKREQERVSEEIEEVLTGTIMRQAREQWDAREWAKRPKPLEELLKNDGYPKPVPMANEEQENAILRSTVRSLLTDLDALLKSLQYTAPERFRWLPKPKKAAFSENHDHVQATQSPAERQLSRIRDRFLDPPDIMTGVKGYEPRAQDRQRQLGQDVMMSDSETSSVSNNPANSEASQHPGDAPLPASGATSAKPRANKRKRQSQESRGLRDWSDVLDVAATTGWDRQVIHRAAQRCSALFGESMSFRVLKEGDIKEPAGRPVQYIPETIPPLPENEDFGPELVRWDYPSTRCPFPNCELERNIKPYFEWKGLMKHLTEFHEFDPFKEKMEKRTGAVHNDGFLTPLMEPLHVGKISKKLNLSGVNMRDYLKTPQPKPYATSGNWGLDADEKTGGKGDGRGVDLTGDRSGRAQ